VRDCFAFKRKAEFVAAIDGVLCVSCQLHSPALAMHVEDGRRRPREGAPITIAKKLESICAMSRV